MLRVVFENEHFLAIDKPAGVLSVPSRLGAADSRLTLEKILDGKSKHFPVHRLDCEVSGLLLIAKNEQAHRIANGWFEKREVKKTYEAWTEKSDAAAEPSKEMSLWESRLAKGKKRAFEAEHGKPALTEARYLGACADGVHAWSLSPRTGRSHQLRFELSKRKFSILGDRLYGSSKEFRKNEIALRAVKIDFSDCSGSSDLGLPKTLEVVGLEAVQS